RQRRIYQIAMVSNAQLDNEKSMQMYQVDMLRETLLELEEQLYETQREETTRRPRIDSTTGKNFQEDDQTSAFEYMDTGAVRPAKAAGFVALYHSNTKAVVQIQDTQPSKTYDGTKVEQLLRAERGPEACSGRLENHEEQNTKQLVSVYLMQVATYCSQTETVQGDGQNLGWLFFCASLSVFVGGFMMLVTCRFGHGALNRMHVRPRPTWVQPQMLLTFGANVCSVVMYILMTRQPVQHYMQSYSPMFLVDVAFHVFYLLIFGIRGVFASYVPEVVEIIVNRKRFSGSYRNTSRETHVVVCGHITLTSVSAFMKEFLHEDRGDVDVNVLFLGSLRPDLELEAFFNLHFMHATFFQGSVLERKDQERVMMDKASACLILCDRFTTDHNNEDSANLMSSVMPPCGVQAYLQNVPNWDRTHGDAVICLAELKLGFMAQSCQVPGLSTLLANLFTMQSEVEKEGPSWQNLYRKGLYNEIYTEYLSASFTGLTFAQASNVLVNPPSTLKLKNQTLGFIIASNATVARRSELECELGPTETRQQQYTCCLEKDDVQLDSTGMFHWCSPVSLQDITLTRQTARALSLRNHVLVCVFGDECSSLLGLRDFLMPLRASSLTVPELKTVVFLGQPQYFSREWLNINYFPKILFLPFVSKVDGMQGVSSLALTEAFAVGSVFSVDLLDSLVAATYFNANVPALICTLVTGGDTPLLEAQLAEDNQLEQGVMTPKLSAIRQRPKLALLGLNEEPLNRLTCADFKDLFCQALDCMEIMCFGLYRLLDPPNPSQKSGPQSHLHPTATTPHNTHPPKHLTRHNIPQYPPGTTPTHQNTPQHPTCHNTSPTTTPTDHNTPQHLTHHNTPPASTPTRYNTPPATTPTDRNTSQHPPTQTPHNTPYATTPTCHNTSPTITPTHHNTLQHPSNKTPHLPQHQPTTTPHCGVSSDLNRNQTHITLNNSSVKKRNLRTPGETHQGRRARGDVPTETEGKRAGLREEEPPDRRSEDTRRNELLYATISLHRATDEPTDEGSDRVCNCKGSSYAQLCQPEESWRIWGGNPAVCCECVCACKNITLQIR
ncbi:hypothetical protein P4O66_012107, partial [Electrophorus voltai]